MVTYNLTNRCLVRNVDGEDCFCVLGIYLREKGEPVERIREAGFTLLKKDEYESDLFEMASYLRSVWGRAGTTCDYTAIYMANDRETSDGFAVGPDDIKEALARVGIDVDLVDKREPVQW